MIRQGAAVFLQGPLFLPPQPSVDRFSCPNGSHATEKAAIIMTSERSEHHELDGPNPAAAEESRAFPGGTCRPGGRFKAGCFQMGERSFPQLKIPHHNPAYFCSTDTAGGLDNKKRRYAPRGGVAYRLFLWGFPKGATPSFGTRLCLQSVVCYTLCLRCRENAVAAG